MLGLSHHSRCHTCQLEHTRKVQAALAEIAPIMLGMAMAKDHPLEEDSRAGA